MFTPGDGLITRDTESGLDWLDVYAMTPAGVRNSVQTVLTSPTSPLNLGFRYPSRPEVCGLVATYAAPLSCSNPSVDADVALPLQTALGFRFDPGRITDGAFDDGGVFRMLSIRGAVAGSSVSIDPLPGPLDWPVPGHFLVRPVPEPATGALLFASLVGYAWAARRKRAASATPSSPRGG
jgi:hypothetical protein